MKITTKIVALSALVLASVSCAKHDFIDENTITGKVGPQAYWEIESAAVKAGESMGFSAQYYSTAADIDHSEVWYDIMETIDQTVSCPWVSTFTYTISSNVTERKRISQMIEEYPHLQEYWNDSLHAYAFKGAFPISGTLSPFSWSHPEEFDSTKMENYFGPTYMQEFKDGVHAKMKFADYRKMYVGMGIVDDFIIYTDSTEDKNQGEGIYVYHFPKDAEGNEVVPYAIDSIWETITFKQLVENSANGYYDVDYNRSYSINAQMRVYDDRGVYGTTVSKEITIN